MFFSLSLLDHPWIQNAKKAPNVPLGDIVRARLKQFSVMNRFKKKALRVSINYDFVLRLLRSGALHTEAPLSWT